MSDTLNEKEMERIMCALNKTKVSDYKLYLSNIDPNNLFVCAEVTVAGHEVTLGRWRWNGTGNHLGTENEVWIDGCTLWSYDGGADVFENNPDETPLEYEREDGEDDSAYAERVLGDCESYADDIRDTISSISNIDWAYDLCCTYYDTDEEDSDTCVTKMNIVAAIIGNDCGKVDTKGLNDRNIATAEEGRIVWKNGAELRYDALHTRLWTLYRDGKVVAKGALHNDDDVWRQLCNKSKEVLQRVQDAETVVKGERLRLTESRIEKLARGITSVTKTKGLHCTLYETVVDGVAISYTEWDNDSNTSYVNGYKYDYSTKLIKALVNA